MSSKLPGAPGYGSVLTVVHGPTGSCEFGVEAAERVDVVRAVPELALGERRADEGDQQQGGDEDTARRSRRGRA